MQAITEAYQALGHLMRATESLALTPPVKKKAVKLSVAAERSVKRLLDLLKQEKEE